MTERLDLIVIGGGIAGSAAALRAAQYHLRTAWLLGDPETAKRSRSKWVANIDNMVGMSDGIVRRKLIKALKGPEHEAARKAIAGVHHLHVSTRDLIEDTRERIASGYDDWVEQIELAAGGIEHGGEDFLVCAGERTLRAGAVVLATGVMDRQPSIRRKRGEEILDDPKWIYPFANRESVLYCIRCEGHLTARDRVAVIGFGPSAAELALMLHERYGSACCVLTNGEQPRWSDVAAGLIDAYGLGVHTDRIEELLGTRGELQGLRLAGGSEVRVRFALVSLGLHRVYNDLARALGAELADEGAPEEERHVLVDAVGETSVRDFYAVGDLAMRADEPIMKQVYTAQEYAVRAVDSVDRRKRRARRRAVLSARPSSRG